MKTIFVPYRINLIGAHIDHQQGITASVAINKGITIKYEPCLYSKITSINYNQTQIINNNDKENNWIDYYKGALSVLNKYDIKLYINATIKGDFPIGGLSSSSAVIIAYLLALLDVNNINITPNELVELAYKVEHNYLGLNIGKLDQNSIVFSKENELLIYDHKYHKIKYKPFNFDCDLYIIHSGLERNLTTSDYNNRVLDIKNAINKYNKYYDTNFDVLRDINQESFKNIDLTLNEQNRLLHYYTEMERVQEAINTNDLKIFSNLINKSCLSSIINYQSGCEQLIYLHKELLNKNYVYANRFNGAGFKGSLYALVRHNKENEIKEVLNQYNNLYNLNSTYSIVKTINGIAETGGN